MQKTPAVVCFLALFCVRSIGLGQAASNVPPLQPKDSEYSKFDNLASVLRARHAKQFAIPAPVAIPAPKGIEERQYVMIGGIEEWVTIRGYDRNNPVLLFVDGGPGDVTNPWTFAMFGPWEKQFAVAQWDQRGAGRTIRKNGPSVAPTMTVAWMVQDGIAPPQLFGSI